MIRPETFLVGLRELGVNKLRTTLTGLGIVFGVAAVIAMVSIAEGARYEAVRQIEALGTNAIRVRAVELSGQELAVARQKGQLGLTLDDGPALALLPVVDLVAPIAVLEAPVRCGERGADLRVVGTTPEHARIVSARLAAGRFLHAEDLRARRRVAVLGARAAAELLPFRHPIGEDLTIGSETFRVIGLMEDRRQASSRVSVLTGADPGREVYVPATTLEYRYANDRGGLVVAELALRVSDDAEVRVAAEFVRRTLLRRHAGTEDFEVIVPEELLRQSQASQRVFNVVMGAIASISLLVGGIGIMNVMLVTVVQRTREIGVRRAVGATQADIRDQFLVEALIIAVAGGLAGVVLGALLAGLISARAGWVTVISPGAVLVAFVVAGVTGVVFGLFPALKASRVDPIECLRHE